MRWWAWIIGGAILLGAELFLVDVQFYLVFVGTAALIAGAATLVIPVTAAAQWILFAVLVVVSMVLFRNRLYLHLRGGSKVGLSGRAVGSITLPVALAPGASCRAEHGGSFWTVRNDGGLGLAAGTQARVVGVDGLTLVVREENKAQ